MDTDATRVDNNICIENLYTNTDLSGIRLLYPELDIKKMSFEELSQCYLKMLSSEQSVLHDISLRARCKTSEEMKLLIGINSAEHECQGIRCKRCKEYNVHYKLVQTRSADEAMTAIYQCRACKYTWST